jgi:hypothetical protein
MMVIYPFLLSYFQKKTRESIHLISSECTSPLMSAVASDAKSGSRLPAISDNVKAINHWEGKSIIINTSID